jgi:deoxyribodipyrimidine photo-lyase
LDGESFHIHFYTILKTSNNPINEKFSKSFHGAKVKKIYRLWKNAKTGIPLIDAAMKQIYDKGWMHNRLRMVVGSFLVKNLIIKLDLW